MGTAFRLMGIGWYVALSIMGGVIGGYLLDRWLGLSPLFTLFGLIAGVAFAFIGMYRMLTAVMSETSESREQRKK